MLENLITRVLELRPTLDFDLSLVRKGSEERTDYWVAQVSSFEDLSDAALNMEATGEGETAIEAVEALILRLTEPTP